MPTKALKLDIPKLPKLDTEDVRAVRSFLPGKLLGRTAAFLSLVLLVLGFAIGVRIGLHQFLGLDISLWAYGLVIVPALLAVIAQVVLEWRAERNRRFLQALAVNPGVEQTGYFRIGPYQDTPDDRVKFSRPDQAEKKVLLWIKKATQNPLYLTGDSGSGKSSLLNAFVLPTLRDQGWTIVEARAWQDPQGMLRKELQSLPGMRRPKAGENRNLREIIEEAARRAPGRLLIVLDQFEEFVILATLERKEEFAAFVMELQTRPANDLVLLLVLRSDYQMLLEDMGLPLLRSGDNLFQVARFQLSAANAFMRRSGLDLQPQSLDRLLTSAAELDDTPGLVRPITLNVIGYVLASGKAVAASLDAGALVRQFIEQTVEQPTFRDQAPAMLEQMITEQGTKRPRSEQDLASAVNLRPAEVRAILNGLGEVGLARPLDPAQAVWELSHDFIARAVARVLGRRRSQWLRRTWAYTAPALLAITLLGAAGVMAWNRFSPDRIRIALAEVGILTTANPTGFTVIVKSIQNDDLSAVTPLMASLNKVTALDLSGTEVTDLDPLKALTTLQSLDLSQTKVSDLGPLKGLTALQSLNLSQTAVTDLGPIKGLTALQSLNLSETAVTDLGPLKGLTALQSLNLSETEATDLELLKGLTALQSLDLSQTAISDLGPLEGLTALQSLNLAGAKVTDLEPLEWLTALQSLDLSQTTVTDLAPLKRLTALQSLNLSETEATDFEPLKGLTTLQSLDLSQTGITDLEPLKGLTALQSLNLGAKVTDLEPLKGLTRLRSLELLETAVTDLEPLKGLMALRSLKLGHTVTNLEPLYDLPYLRLKVVAGEDGSIDEQGLDRYRTYRKERNLPP